MTIFPDVPAAYDVIAEKFFGERSTALRENKYLDLLLNDLEVGARVLDFGCGTGRPIGEEVLRRGYELTGVDGSAGMLAIARRVMPDARLIRSRLEDVELTGTFAAAIAWDSLFHVDRRHHASIYGKFARWLAPGGRLLLSSGGTEDPGFTDHMHGETFFYSSWSPQKACELLEAAGFAIELCELDQPAGRGHVAVIARRKT
ncbi:MAG: class I SAM-dependent methyltransferase [Opitutaceae bacterium]